MIASLAMYHRPETEGALNRLWQGLRVAYPGDTPVALRQDGNLWDQWRSPDLLLSQTCGMPYRTSLHGQVSLVGSPITGLDCLPGYYDSAIVARADDPREAFEAFEGARLAYNEAVSQSGWAAPMTFAAAQGVRFSDFLRTGAHRASAAAVAGGQADLAALDGVTWQMIERWDGVAAGLKVIGRTPPTPALPFITAKGRDPEPLFQALSAAIAGLSSEDRDTLSLNGLTKVSASAYLSVPSPQPPPG